MRLIDLELQVDEHGVKSTVWAKPDTPLFTQIVNLKEKSDMSSYVFTISAICRCMDAGNVPHVQYNSERPQQRGSG